MFLHVFLAHTLSATYFLFTNPELLKMSFSVESRLTGTHVPNFLFICDNERIEVRGSTVVCLVFEKKLNLGKKKLKTAKKEKLKRWKIRGKYEITNEKPKIRVKVANSWSGQVAASCADTLF